MWLGQSFAVIFHTTFISAIMVSNYVFHPADGCLASLHQLQQLQQLHQLYLPLLAGLVHLLMNTIMIMAEVIFIITTVATS